MGSAGKDKNVVGFLIMVMNLRICNSREKPGAATYDPQAEKKNPSKDGTLPVKGLKFYKAARKCIKFQCSMRSLRLHWPVCQDICPLRVDNTYLHE
jgi:hypothetical protein